MRFWLKGDLGCCCGGTPAEPSPLGQFFLMVWGWPPATGAGFNPHVTTLQEGKPTATDRLQQLKFGGAITGGSFTLTVSTQTTSAIAWSSVDAVLLANIETALVALSNLAPGDVTLTAGTLSAGHGTILLSYPSTYTLGVGSTASSLTGTSPTVVIRNVRLASTSTDDVQEFSINHGFGGGLPTGGTFKLEFDGQTTSSLTWAVPGGVQNLAGMAATIETALMALSNIGSGNITVDEVFPGTFNRMRVAFLGALSGTDVAPLTFVDEAMTGNTVTPISGATVDLYKDGVLRLTGTTDSQGLVSFDLDEIGPGYTYNVSASGYTTQTGLQPTNGTDAAGTLSGGFNGFENTLAMFLV